MNQVKTLLNRITIVCLTLSPFIKLLDMKSCSQHFFFTLLTPFLWRPSCFFLSPHSFFINRKLLDRVNIVSRFCMISEYCYRLFWFLNRHSDVINKIQILETTAFVLFGLFKYGITNYAGPFCNCVSILFSPLRKL